MRSIRYLQKPFGIVLRRIRDEKRLRIIFISLLGVLLLLVALAIWYPAEQEDLDLRRGKYILNTEIKKLLIRTGLKEMRVHYIPSRQISLAFSYPADTDLQALLDYLAKELKTREFTVYGTDSVHDGEGAVVFVEYHNRAVGMLSILPAELDEPIAVNQARIQRKPKLVIIIDDFGYSNNGTVNGFMKLEAPLTVSIIPGHRFSRWASATAQAAGKEVMIHMPMEPEDFRKNHGEEQFLIHSGLGPYEINQRVLAAIMELPEAKGMNNHMGSRATADAELMSTVIRNLKEKGMYFIDSLTSAQSVAFEIARENGVPAAVRTVFLDNQRDKSEILAQFEKALTIARKRGKAVAIGHVYPQTLEVLRYLLSSGKLADVDLVFASEGVS